MLPPVAWLVILVAWAGSIAGVFFYGVSVGEDREVAAVAREDRIAALATEAAASAAAAAISRITVKNTTIRQTLEKEVREKPVYRDCVADPAARKLLNDTIGRAAPATAAGDGELPAAGASR